MHMLWTIALSMIYSVRMWGKIVKVRWCHWLSIVICVEGCLISFVLNTTLSCFPSLSSVCEPWSRKNSRQRLHFAYHSCFWKLKLSILKFHVPYIFFSTWQRRAGVLKKNSGSFFLRKTAVLVTIYNMRQHFAVRLCVRHHNECDSIALTGENNLCATVSATAAVVILCRSWNYGQVLWLLVQHRVQPKFLQIGGIWCLCRTYLSPLAKL